MFFLRLPDDARIRSLLTERAEAPFSHDHEGVTREPLSAAPRGFRLDRYEAEIGHGPEAFARARAALERFGNYPSSFTRVVPLQPELAPGTVFATTARHAGFASLHPCRVVFVIDAPEAGEYGFGLGTLPGHIGSGEECFRVTLDPEDGRVHYRVQAISRPAGWLGHLGAPIFRLFQARFRRETVAEMRRAVAGPDRGA